MTATRNVKGLLGTKLGMTQVWDENNKLIPVTVVQADSNVITQLRNADTDGYVAVQIGYGQIDPRKVTFIQDKVKGIRPQDKQVDLVNREEPLTYDYLVIGLGSADEGVRAGVGSTPSFVIGGRIYPGVLPYDKIKGLVDSLSPAPAP